MTLECQEVDQATVTLKNRHVQYEDDLYALKERSRSPNKGQFDPTGKENTPKLNFWGKPERPARFTKSHNAMFQRDSDLEALKYAEDKQPHLIASHFRMKEMKE